MPRFSRIVISDCPHHITQRGNNRQAVFFVDDDYRVYLKFLDQQSEKHSLKIYGYCLMPNHVHIVATPSRKESLAKALGRTHFLYTQYVNRFHGRSGHLWQNRFYSCPLDEKHFYEAMVYVERNPVKARLCRAAWRYSWSSAAWHCGMAESTNVALVRWNVSASDWQLALSQRDDKRDELICLRTQTGRPLGSDSFLSKLETILGRRVRPLPIGRPSKKNR